jgi:hypothetical protein
VVTAVVVHGSTVRCGPDIDVPTKAGAAFAVRRVGDHRSHPPGRRPPQLAAEQATTEVAAEAERLRPVALKDMLPDLRGQAPAN